MLCIKMSKVIAAAALVLMLAPLAVFAGGQKEEPAATAPEAEQETTVSTEAAEPETVTITDSSGREVTITKPIEKIVFNHLTIAEALRIVDGWDRLIGRDGLISDTILYSNLDELPAISNPMKPYDVNFEKVFELHPDIFLTIYTTTMSGLDDIVASLEPEIPVVALNFYEPETIVENLRKLGLILGQEDEAEEFIEFYKEIEAAISGVTSKIPDEDKQRMFYKLSMGNVADLMTYSNDMTLCSCGSEITGSINIAADLPSQGGVVFAVDPEWLVEQDPDVLICCHPVPGIFGFGVDNTSAAEALRNEIMKLDVFSGGSAVKNGNVYLIPADLLGNIVSFPYMAKWFHLNLFTGLDPQAIHQEYLTRFMRIDYDLEKHGVFVYPEP